MEAIILSGMPAAGKTTISKIISKRLKIPVIGGGDVLREMAIERGYTPSGDDWWDKEEGMKFLAEREKNSDFDKEADSRLIKKIKSGNIVITSYTAPWLTNLGFKVWLFASQEKRTQRMSKRDHMDVSQTKKIVDIRDEENHKIYMNLYHIDFGVDLKPFNLIVDTNNKDPESITDIILKEFEKRGTKK